MGHTHTLAEECLGLVLPISRWGPIESSREVWHKVEQEREEVLSRQTRASSQIGPITIIALWRLPSRLTFGWLAGAHLISVACEPFNC